MTLSFSKSHHHFAHTFPLFNLSPSALPNLADFMRSLDYQIHGEGVDDSGKLDLGCTRAGATVSHRPSWLVEKPRYTECNMLRDGC